MAVNDQARTHVELAGQRRAGGDLPGASHAMCRDADALHAQGDLPAAIAAYTQVVVLDDGNLPAWWGLGCAALAQGEHAQAAEAFARVVTLAPQHGHAHHNLGTSLFRLGEIDRALDAFSRARTLVDAPDITRAAAATIAPGAPGADDRTVADARRSWAAGVLPASHRTPAGRPVRSSNERLRVGYISSFFAYPNWMKPVWGLVNHHRRDRFEIHLFSDAPRSDVEYGYANRDGDRFHDIRELTNREVADLVAAEEIDLLVDLNGYSRPSRLPALMMRPAPVQVAWFNMFAPSGLDCFDYLIGDIHVLPEGDPAEQAYRERVVRVPGSYLTFEVTYPVPDVTPAPGVSRGYLTFGCLCPLYKLTPPVIDLWASILRAAPASRLFLKNSSLDASSNRAFVIEAFGRRGVAAGRLVLEGRADHLAFLGRYAEIDLALDPFPYNGGTTTMEALWQGVPVLTHAGDRWASRISASLLRAAGLSEFVCRDLDAYAAAAVELATDAAAPARLTEIRLSMRDRLRQHPVCDVREFARAMERLYLAMWREHIDGRVTPGITPD